MSSSAIAIARLPEVKQAQLEARKAEDAHVKLLDRLQRQVAKARGLEQSILFPRPGDQAPLPSDYPMPRTGAWRCNKRSSCKGCEVGACKSDPKRQGNGCKCHAGRKCKVWDQLGPCYTGFKEVPATAWEALEGNSRRKPWIGQGSTPREKASIWSNLPPPSSREVSISSRAGGKNLEEAGDWRQQPCSRPPPPRPRQLWLREASTRARGWKTQPSVRPEWISQFIQNQQGSRRGSPRGPSSASPLDPWRSWMAFLLLFYIFISRLFVNNSYIDLLVRVRCVTEV